MKTTLILILGLSLVSCDEQHQWNGLDYLEASKDQPLLANPAASKEDKVQGLGIGGGSEENWFPQEDRSDKDDNYWFLNDEDFKIIANKVEPRKDDIPAVAINKDLPPAAKKEDLPAKANKEDLPAKANKDNIPAAKANKEDLPAEANKENLPAEANKEAVPAQPNKDDISAESSDEIESEEKSDAKNEKKEPKKDDSPAESSEEIESEEKSDDKNEKKEFGSDMDASIIEKVNKEIKEEEGRDAPIKDKVNKEDKEMEGLFDETIWNESNKAKDNQLPADISVTDDDNSEEGTYDVYYVLGSVADFYYLQNLLSVIRQLGAPSNIAGYKSDRMQMVLAPMSSSHREETGTLHKDEQYSALANLERKMEQLRDETADAADEVYGGVKSEAFTLRDNLDTVLNKAKAGLTNLKRKLDKTLRRRDTTDLILMTLFGVSVLLLLANMFECVFMKDNKRDLKGDYYRLKDEPYNPALPTYEECVLSDKAHLVSLHYPDEVKVHEAGEIKKVPLE